jgi:hypothetical protein
LVTRRLCLAVTAAVCASSLGLSRVSFVSADTFTVSESRPVAAVMVRQGQTLLTSGTAFCIASTPKDSLYLTARHVVADALGGDNTITVDVVRQDGSSSGLAASQIIPGNEWYEDIAVLKVSAPCSQRVTFERAVKKQSDKVTAYGFTSSQIKNDDKAHEPYVPGPLSGGIYNYQWGTRFYALQVSGVQVGMSGAPLYDSSNGQVIGLVVTIDDMKHIAAPQGADLPNLDASLSYAIEASSVLLPFLQGKAASRFVTDSRALSVSIPQSGAPIAAPLSGAWVGGGFLDGTRFGGSFNDTPYCSYQTDIKVDDLRLYLRGGKVARGQLVTEMDESAVSTCPAPPIPLETQTFAFVDGSASGNGVTARFEGSPTAKARSNALLQGQVSADGTLFGTLVFNRVDEVPPFNWVIPIRVDLDKIPPLSGRWNASQTYNTNVSYGGGRYCRYSSSVSVDNLGLAISAGALQSVKLKITPTEKVLQPCTQQGILSNTQFFTARTPASVSDDAVDLQLEGSSQRPRLHAHLQLKEQLDGALAGTLSLYRDDTGDPSLDWSVGWPIVLDHLH